MCSLEWMPLFAFDTDMLKWHQEAIFIDYVIC